ncbi:hypothetical protein KAR02_11060 [Candidatus Bipolaricaulota bacterium]|nr:hypothetical protein [Candidatus Bipolaricaulota bacterium]
MNRYTFDTIFQDNPDGSLVPKRVISVNNITIGPGVAFGHGVSFGGVDLTKYRNFDIAAEEENGVLVIKGFYKKDQ